MAGNKIYVQGSYIDVHDNENVYLSVDKAEVRMGQAAAEEAPATLTEDLLGRAVGGVKEYIWGNAAYAVLFCVCRDEYGWQDNASYFERQLSLLGINIPAGTLNAAISRKRIGAQEEQVARRLAHERPPGGRQRLHHADLLDCLGAAHADR